MEKSKLEKFGKKTLLFFVAVSVAVSSYHEYQSLKEENSKEDDFNIQQRSLTNQPVKWNCYNPLILAKVPVGKTVDVWQEHPPDIKDTSCVYGAKSDGTLIKVGVEGEIYGYEIQGNKQNFEGKPFPNVATRAIVLVLVENPDKPLDNIVKAIPFTRPFQRFEGELAITNTYGKDLFLVAVSNIPQSYKEETFHNLGYTVSLVVREWI